MELVREETYRQGSDIRVVFHPNPEQTVIHGNWGVRVEVGPQTI